MPRDRIFISGAYNYDDIHDAVTESRERALRSLYKNACKNEIIILLSSAYVNDAYLYKQDKEILLNDVAVTIKKIGNCKLIIKLLPLDSNDIERRIFGSLIAKSKFVITKDYNLYNLINSYDIMFSFHSTSNYISLLFDKPLIILNFSKIRFFSPFIDEGIAIPAESQQELKDAVNLILPNKERRYYEHKNAEKFKYRHLFLMDGKATQRVSEIVHNLARRELIKGNEFKKKINT